MFVKNLITDIKLTRQLRRERGFSVISRFGRSF